ncbi:hypothetical protein OsJ_20646 [Oryza sativa Japonica Group]|uniref:Uncharacterized protein n=1 Tax=Oryza sativa subsp. japonica TaxID=39947 RepID=B9FSA0_ORYSJ|nr:hypothetical protein OsJ_20646 [Oryza sativa Japonica Group]
MLSAVGYAFSPSLSLHPAVAPLPPLVCSEGCYEDVIRASSSLPKMPLILPRMDEKKVGPYFLCPLGVLFSSSIGPEKREAQN